MENNKNNIVHITSELSIKNYSITSFIIFLINKTNNVSNNKIFVESVSLKTNLPTNVKFLLFKNKWSDFFNIKNKIIASYKVNTTFHLHGLWSPLQIYSFFILTYLNFPVVVHTHGMLLRPALQKNGTVKKIIKNFVLFFFNYIAQNKRIKFISITTEEK